MALHFKKRGHGQPLILIHGLFGSLENLGAIARLLSEHFTVYSIDLPNHGRSAHTPTVSLDIMLEQLRAWLKSQGIEKAHFVGHSLGGKVAMELALQSPEFVDQLVVMDIAPVHYNPHHNQVFEGLLALDLNTLSSRSQADEQLAVKVPEYPVRSFLLKNLAKAPAGHFEWRMNLSAIHQGYADLIRENAPGPFDGQTLFLKGGASDYIKEQYRDAIVSRFPNLQLKIVANTGHWLHAEKPDMVARLIEKFLLQD